MGPVDRGHTATPHASRDRVARIDDMADEGIRLHSSRVPGGLALMGMARYGPHSDTLVPWKNSHPMYSLFLNSPTSSACATVTSGL